MEPNLGNHDEDVPAADPGTGAPPPAEGFGVGGEEPDRPEEASADEVAESGSTEEPPFRTPDPREVGPA